MKTKIDKEKVRELYLAGYRDSQIAKKLNANKETIKTCIKRNFSELKREHEISVIEKREELKAINYEANKFISPGAFVKKNRSIYKTRPDGDIVINRDVAPIVTWDTPRQLVNENKYS